MPGVSTRTVTRGLARPSVGARRRRGRNDPGAQASLLVQGYPDPPTTQQRAIFTRSLLFDGNAGVVSNNTISISPSSIGVAEAKSGGFTATRFTDIRIRRIEVWGRADPVSTLPIGDTALRLVLTAAQSDNGSWVDYGITGSARPHIAVIPNLDFRDHWYSLTSATEIFQVQAAGITAQTQAGDYLIRISADYR